MTPKLLSIDGAKAAKKTGTGPFTGGAQVHLKSGGPLMTVETPGPEWTSVVWMDDVGNDMGPRQYKNEVLMLYSPKPKPKRKPAPVSRRRASAK